MSFQNDTHRLVAVRRQKIDELRRQGIDPYPARVDVTHNLSEAAALFKEAESNGKERSDPIAVAGRIVAIRAFGKLAFLTLSGNSHKLQIQFRADVLGEQYQLIKYLDTGDFLQAEGPLFRTRLGEITLEVNKAHVLGKSIRPLPEKHHGLKDEQLRRRQRYLEMISSEAAISTVIKRARITDSIRQFMRERGFTELETSILNTVAAGAAAEPFRISERKYWDKSDRLYLRIATELPLKKALIGGIERAYEIGKVFRNESADENHSPEFTTMEAYQAFASYEDMMALTENLFAQLAVEINGTTELTLVDGTDVDLSPPWKRIDLRSAIIQYADIDFVEYINRREDLVRRMKDGGMFRTDNANLRERGSWGRLVDSIISQKVEPQLKEPCFLVDYPIETTPFAKAKPGTEGIVERAEAFIGAKEVANMFTELNDPVQQRERMMALERIRKEFRDDESDRVDEDFLDAMDYCMPPAGGIGIGIDRMVMLLTGTKNIGDVLLFPNLYKA